MPSNNPYNSFGDESLDPSKPTADETIYGAPRTPEKKEPPLPGVELSGPDTAPEKSAPRRHQPRPDQPVHGQGRERDNHPSRVGRRRINWGWMPVWIFVLALSGLTGFYVLHTRKELAEEASDLSFKPSKARMTLSANHGWRDFAFILRPGDQVAIRARGEYTQSSGGTVTGDGIPGSEGEKKGSRAYDPIFPHGCLIARTVGNPTEVFHIGRAGILTTTRGGRLQVRINDLDLVANEGELEIEVETFFREPPPGVKMRGSRDSSVTPIRR